MTRHADLELDVIAVALILAGVGLGNVTLTVNVLGC